MEYMIDAFDNHLILVNKDKKILIDTGSPISISNQEEIEIFGLTHKSSQTYLGVTIDGISKRIGYDLDALVGGDILKNLIFQVDFNNRLFSVLESFPCEDRDGKEVVDIDLYMDIPIIEILVGKDSTRAFLDTGAKISYLNRQRTEGLKAIDEREDFYPTFGTFSTPIYEVPVNFKGREILLTFGVLPEPLEASLSMANTTAIIGNDIFSHFSLTFDYKNKKVCF